MKVLMNDGTVSECPENEEVHVLRHSAAHIMAQAVKRLYPDAQFAFGPATEKASTMILIWETGNSPMTIFELSKARW